MLKRLSAVALGLCVAGAIGSAGATGEDGTAEQIGKKIDQGIDSVFSGVQKEWGNIRQSIEKMGVQARVYGRLHWDTALESASLDIEARKGNVIVLHGSVPNAVAKLKAVELARDTIGVKEVVDEWSISPPKNATSK